MSSQIKFLLVISLLCGAAACGYAIGSNLPEAADKETIVTSCPVAMTDIIQSSKGNVYELDDSNYVEPEAYYLVTYSVVGDENTNPVFSPIPNELKGEQSDSFLQQDAWQIFTALIPAKNRQMVSQYTIFTDGSENTLAAVDQTKDDLTRWIVEVDSADLGNKDELLFTLIHEYAHLLTLNNLQVAVDEEIYNDPFNISLIERKAAACPNYFTGGGCSQPNSYINAFHQRFWVDLNSEWKKIDAMQFEDDLLPYYEGLYNFYLAHQDQFVDDYATTYPAEDIAESFTYFVFSPKPVGLSIKEQKILFFYEYPELIRLRQSILEGACSIVQE